jgi:PAS domain S-box-containing protein
MKARDIMTKPSIDAKILVVDDDDAIRRMTTAILGSAGYEVISATNGEEALAMARAHRPDLILLDVDMPIMDGMEALRRIKADPVLAFIFVIIFSSARVDAQSQVLGLDVGADGYLTRPISHGELLAHVHALLRIQAAEAKLRRSEERFAKAFRASPAMLTITTLAEGRYIDVNESYVELLGYSRAELIGRTAQELGVYAYPEERAGMLDILREQGVVRNLEMHVCTKAGAIRTVSFSVEATEINGEACLIGTALDITERNRAEQALRASEQKYRLLAENMQDVIFQVSPDLVLTYLTPSAERLFGRKADEVLGRSVLELLTPRSRREVGALASQAVQYAQQEDLADFFRGSFEIEIMLEEGHTTWLEVSASPYYDAARQMLGFQGVALDITERKRTEQALRKSEERFSKAFHSSSAGVSITRQDDGRFIDANDSFIAMSGYSRAEVIGHRAVEDLRIYALAGERSRLMRLFHEQGRLHDEEVMLSTRTGGQRIVLLSSQPIELDGVNCVLTTSVDITERKRAEQALHESEERLRLAHQVASLGAWSEDLVAGTVRFDDNARAHFDLDGTGDVTYAAIMTRVHSDDAAELLQLLHAAAGRVSDDLIPAEFRVVHRDGSVHWLSVQARIEHEGEGAARHLVRAIGVSQDITARKQVELALQHSESKFRSYIEHAPFGICVFDRTGDLVEVNSPAASHLGYTEAEMLALRFPDVVASSSLSEAREWFNTVLREGTATGETLLRRKDGTTFWVLNLAVRLDGERALVFYRDITAQRQMVTALAEREQRLRSILKAALDGYTLMDTRARYVDVNDAYCAMVGYTRDELLSMHVWDMEAVEGKSQVAAHIEKVIAEGSDRFETRQRRKDGTLVDVEISLNYLDQDGGLVVGFLRDITQRKQVALSLSESEARFRSYLENSPLGLFVVDHAGRLIDCNPVAGKMMGRKASALRGCLLQEMNPHISRQFIDDGLATLARVGRLSGEYHLLSKTGKPVWIAAHIVALPNGHYLAYCQDISDRKWMEEALRSSEGRLAEAQRIAHIGSWEWDQRSDTILWSDEMYRLYERDPQSPVPAHDDFMTYIHPEDQGKVVSRSKAISPGQRLDMEYRVLLSGGRVKWIHDQSEIVTDAAGRSIMVRGTMQDITERKQAESQRETALAALRASEAQYRLLAENMEDVIWILNPLTGRFSYVSPSVERLRGYTVDEVLAQPMADVMTRASLDVVRKGLVEGAELGRGVSQAAARLTEVEQTRKDGSTVWTEVVTRWFEDEHGSLRILGVSRDITARKASEQALRESEQKFRSMAEQLAEALYMTDAAGVITYMSPATGKLFGWRPEEMVGHAFVDFLVEADIPRAVASFMEAVTQGTQVKELELTIRRMDGSTFTGELSSALLMNAERVAGTIGVIRDITERRMAEQALRHSEAILRESETRYRTLFSAMSEAFFLAEMIRDDEGRPQDYLYLEVNPAMARHLHADIDQCVGRRASEVFRPLSPEILERYSQVARTGDPDHFEFDSIALGRSFEAHVFSPAPERFGVLALDITERKRAEVAVRQSEQKFATAFRISPDAVAINRLRDAVVVDINDGYLALTGYTRAEAIGHTTLEMNIYADPALRSRLISLLKERGEASNVEVEFRRKDGTNFIGLLSARLVELDGEMHILSITRDISERKRAEEQIQRQLESLGALYEGARQLAGSLDPLKLAEEVARACVQVFGLRFAWLGSADPDGQVRPLAQYPPDVEYARQVTIRWDNRPEGQGPTGRSIRYGFPVLTADVLTDPGVALWRANMAQYGFRSNGAFPLTSRGQTFGALTLDSASPGFFTPERVRFFESYALLVAAAMQNARLFQSVDEQRERLRVLSARLVETQEEERRRFAMELHDELGQSLTVLTMQLGAALEALPASGNRARAILKTTEELASDTVDQVRRIIADLRPSVLDDLGLAPALRRLGDDLHASTGVSVVVQLADLPSRLPPPVESALYRIAQEALANIRQHAHASNVTITGAAGRNRVRLTIHDDGVGMAQQRVDEQPGAPHQSGDITITGGWVEPAGHYGLLGMQERVDWLGGSFHLESMPQAGTTIQVELPLS